MRGEHYFLLAGLLAIIGGLENVEYWSDLVQVKTVLKMAGASAMLIRSSYVPPRDSHD
jgi:hypothetical protein